MGVSAQTVIRNRAEIRFYAELNDFLPRRRRFVTFEHAFDGQPSIKDMIESLGVPHTEIDLILVNGESVDFSYLVQNGDRVSVYPVFETFDIVPVLRLRPEPLRVVKFVLDIHLGRLAAYLRMLGFDTLYRNDYEDAELARISSEEQRVLLTRDVGLLKRSMVTHGYFVRAAHPQRQLAEVVRHLDLYRMIRPFARCIKCNGEVEPVSEESIAGRLPTDAAAYYNDFRVCRACGQIFWKGSHYERMQRLIDSILEQGKG